MWPIVFQGPLSNFKVTQAEKITDLARISEFSDDNSNFQFTNGYEMTHVAFRSVEAVPFCLSWTFITFKSHTGWKIMGWLQFQHIWTITQIWVQRWIWNDTHSFLDIEEILYNILRSFIKFQNHIGWKIDDSDPILNLRDYNSSFTSQTHMKYYTKLWEAS